MASHDGARDGREQDSVFATVIGLEYMPTAKLLSVLVVSALTVPYNALIDLVARRKRRYFNIDAAAR